MDSQPCNSSPHCIMKVCILWIRLKLHASDDTMGTHCSPPHCRGCACVAYILPLAGCHCLLQTKTLIIAPKHVCNAGLHTVKPASLSTHSSQAMLAHSSATPLCSSRPASTRLQRHARAIPAQPRQRHTLCRAADTSSSSFGEQAQRFADSAQQKMQDFVKQQRLDEKAAEAGQQAQKRIKNWSEETEQNVRRTYMRLESEHNLSQKFERTKTWVSETVRDIDQEWSVRRRLKTTAEDVQRKLPQWRRQFKEFSSTPLGKATLTLAFVSLLFSGLFWQIMNAFWLLFWLSIPVSAVIASQRSKEAAQQQQQQQQQQGPFGGWGSWGSSGFNSSSSSSSGSNRSSSPYSSDGPIVEAEWVSLDENDQPNSSSSRKR